MQVCCDTLRRGVRGLAMVVLPTGRFRIRMGDLDSSDDSNDRSVHLVMALGLLLRHSAR